MVTRTFVRNTLFFSIPILLLSISYTFSFATASNSDLITVSSDKTKYSDGDTIIVSGSVISVIVGTPVTIQILDPNDDLVAVSQVDVKGDGKYSDKIPAHGSLWEYSGIYTIKAQYGPPDVIAETTFSYSKSIAGSKPANESLQKSSVMPTLSQDRLDSWFTKLMDWEVSGATPKESASNAFLWLVHTGHITHSQFKTAMIHDAKVGKEILLTSSPNLFFETKIIKCDVAPGGKYMQIGGQITNLDSDSHTPELVYQGIDKNGGIVTFELGYSDEIGSGNTIFVDHLIKNDPSIDSCDITVNHAN